jgi:hypothetical protein
VTKAAPKYTPIPNLPHVEYAYGKDRTGQFWVYCRCLNCGDTYQRPCSQPTRADRWVVYYGSLHRDC